MRWFKCIVEYDGTNYSGWQRQSNTRMTVQEHIEDVLMMIAKHPVSLKVASRTDAGVHAYGQVISFSMESGIPTERISIAMNTTLPKDIRIKAIEEVTPDFNPRFQSEGKIYHYLLDNALVQSAFRRHYVYHVPKKLNLEAMRQSGAHLIGRHDFSSFRAIGCSSKTPIRTLRRIEVFQEGDLVRLEYEGEGFLYNMVRILTGTVIYAGLGKFSPAQVKQILEAKDRTQAGPTAPPHGLYLVKVFY